MDILFFQNKKENIVLSGASEYGAPSEVEEVGNINRGLFPVHFAMRAKTLLVSISTEIYTALSRDGLYFSSVLIF